MLIFQMTSVLFTEQRFVYANLAWIDEIVSLDYVGLSASSVSYVLLKEFDTEYWWIDACLYGVMLMIFFCASSREDI